MNRLMPDIVRSIGLVIPMTVSDGIEASKLLRLCSIAPLMTMEFRIRGGSIACDEIRSWPCDAVKP